jgi:hypothetical protein
LAFAFSTFFHLILGPKVFRTSQQMSELSNQQRIQSALVYLAQTPQRQRQQDMHPATPQSESVREPREVIISTTQVTVPTAPPQPTVTEENAIEPPLHPSPVSHIIRRQHEHSPETAQTIVTNALSYQRLSHDGTGLFLGRLSPGDEPRISKYGVLYWPDMPGR